MRTMDDVGIPISRVISCMDQWVPGTSSWLRTRSLTVSTFSGVLTLLCLPLPAWWSVVPVSFNFFSKRLTLQTCHCFWKLCHELFSATPFKQMQLFYHWRAVWYCLDWTTATLCCMELQQAVFRNCSACRTLQHGSSSKHRDGHMLSHYWNIYTGYRFTRGSPTSWLY